MKQKCGDKEVTKCGMCQGMVWFIKGNTIICATCGAVFDYDD